MWSVDDKSLLVRLATDGICNYAGHLNPTSEQKQKLASSIVGLFPALKSNQENLPPWASFHNKRSSGFIDVRLKTNLSDFGPAADSAHWANPPAVIRVYQPNLRGEFGIVRNSMFSLQQITVLPAGWRSCIIYAFVVKYTN